jgi:DNA mismatch endonuclease (patch repair protein)
MARVKAKHTKPEMMVRRALHAAGMRYVLHDKRLPGRPDIVIPSRRCVVEVRGCFFHRHPDPTCPFTRTPKSRLDFWLPKFESNVARDKKNDTLIRDLGWCLLVVWECQLARTGAVDIVAAVLAQPVLKRRRPPLALRESDQP